MAVVIVVVLLVVVDQKKKQNYTVFPHRNKIKLHNSSTPS